VRATRLSSVYPALLTAQAGIHKMPACFYRRPYNAFYTQPMTPLSNKVSRTKTVERIASVVGPQGLLTDPRDLEPYVVDWRGVYRGATPAVVRPASTKEVAAVVRICAETATPIVPQGGNTGMCGASVPRADGSELVLSLARMNRVLEIDTFNDTITAEAGCVLANTQQAAADADRFFPLSLGAEGSCQIGGNLSTNAGGVNVLRYGNARDLALGLEVVLPDGRIWNGLRALRKDNTGYDLKHLFIGAEGTLGVITGAVLKLFPRPGATTSRGEMIARDPVTRAVPVRPCPTCPSVPCRRPNARVRCGTGMFGAAAPRGDDPAVPPHPVLADAPHGRFDRLPIDSRTCGSAGSNSDSSPSRSSRAGRSPRPSSCSPTGRAARST